MTPDECLKVCQQGRASLSETRGLYRGIAQLLSQDTKLRIPRRHQSQVADSRFQSTNHNNYVAQKSMLKKANGHHATDNHRSVLSTSVLDRDALQSWVNDTSRIGKHYAEVIKSSVHDYSEELCQHSYKLLNVRADQCSFRQWLRQIQPCQCHYKLGNSASPQRSLDTCARAWTIRDDDFQSSDSHTCRIWYKLTKL